MSRVVSLLPSSTEIVYALGLGDRLVGRSHECDFPESAKALPVLTEPKLDLTPNPVTGREPTSAEIDAQVHALVGQALAIYRVDPQALDALRPDLIITQTQCEVCAVSLRDVEEAVRACVASDPRILALNPTSLEDLFRDIRRVADALGVADRGLDLVREMQARMRALGEQASRSLAGRTPPRVVCIEWIEPLMAAGNWMPTLVTRAGGTPLFGTEGKHSPYFTAAELLAADPDVIVVIPCGWDLERTRREMHVLEALPEWSRLSAVRSGRAFIADGNQYFNRPGPRIVESLAILVDILHGAGDAAGVAGYERVAPIHGHSSVTMPAATVDADQLPAPLPRRHAMALESIRMSAVIPGSSEEIYSAWLDGGRHGEFTGGAASVDARVGGKHTAWDGYIAGEILVLEPGRRIVQSWRSLDFPTDAIDSRLEILLAPAPGGTEISLIHSEIPEGQSGDYEEGWLEYYFKPMQQYFRKDPPKASRAPAAVASKKAPVKKVAPKKKAAAKKAAPKKKAVAKKPAPKKAAAKKKPAPAKKIAAKKAPAASKKQKPKSKKKR